MTLYIKVKVFFKVIYYEGPYKKIIFLYFPFDVYDVLIDQ